MSGGLFPGACDQYECVHFLFRRKSRSEFASRARKRARGHADVQASNTTEVAAIAGRGDVRLSGAFEDTGFPKRLALLAWRGPLFFKRR